MSESPSGVNEMAQNLDCWNSAELRAVLDEITMEHGTVEVEPDRTAILNSLLDNSEPYVEITNQPTKTTRFRYECEKRGHYNLPGRDSGSNNKTLPTICVYRHEGPIILRISCVTKDKDEFNRYKTHPYKIVGNTSGDRGFDERKFTICLDEKIQLSNFTIQCTKKKDFKKILEKFEYYGIDPFRAGFDHANNPGSIDVSVVRLCFQIYLLHNNGSLKKVLAPVVSDPIYGNKDLKIYRVAPSNIPAAGGINVVIFCDKVPKNDLKILIYNKKKDGTRGWRIYAPFRPCDVHKQVAILFKAPEYENQMITEPVQIFLQLERPSDGSTSNPYPLFYVPNEPEDEPYLYVFEELRRKRKIYDKDPSLSELRRLQGIEEPNQLVESSMSPSTPGSSSSAASPPFYPNYSMHGQYSPETAIPGSLPPPPQNRVIQSPENDLMIYQHQDQELNQQEINMTFPGPSTFINQADFQQHVDNQQLAFNTLSGIELPYPMNSFDETV